MYKCNYCDYTTTVNPTLRRHERYKHGEMLTNNLNDLAVPALLPSPPPLKKSMKNKTLRNNHNNLRKIKMIK